MADTAEWITAISALMNAGAGLWNASNQDSTNNQNYANQQARYNQMLQLVGGQMQAGQNPYAAAQLQYMGFNPTQFTPSQQFQMPQATPPTQGQPQLSGPPPRTADGGVVMVPKVGGVYSGGGGGVPAVRAADQASPLQAATKRVTTKAPPGSPGQYQGDNSGPDTAPKGSGSGLTQGRRIVTDPGMNPAVYPPFTGPQAQAPTTIKGGTYNPGAIGNAPAFDISKLFQSMTNYLGTAPQMHAAQASGPGSFAPSDIAGSTIPGAADRANPGLQGLLAMMNQPIGPSSGVMSNLQQLASGKSQFDNSALFKSLQAVNQRNLDQQVAQLQGSRGSLGRILGSNTQRSEALMRENFAQDQSLQNAQIAQSSFEAAQGRRQPALNQLSQLPFQQAQLQQQAATSAAGIGQDQAQLQQQAQMSNQATDLAANQSNLNAQLQAGMQTQQLGTQVGLNNAQQQSAASQFNAGQRSQYDLSALQAAMQGGAADQQLAGQFDLTQYGAQNAASQFNREQQMQAAVANNQFQSGYQGMIQQGLGAAQGYQQQQGGQNAQLLGLLAGVGVPQQQPSAIPGAIGDAASTAMILPMLMQMTGQQSPATTTPWLPTGYNPSPTLNTGLSTSNAMANAQAPDASSPTSMQQPGQPVAQHPAQQAAQDAQNSIQEVIQHLIGMTGQQTAQPPVQQPVQQPVQHPTQAPPAQKPTAKPAPKPVQHQPAPVAKKPAPKPAPKAAPSAHPAEQPAKTAQTAIHEVIQHLAKQPAPKAPAKPAKKPAPKPAKKPVASHQ